MKISEFYNTVLLKTFETKNLINLPSVPSFNIRFLKFLHAL